MSFRNRTVLVSLDLLFIILSGLRGFVGVVADYFSAVGICTSSNAFLSSMFDFLVTLLGLTAF